MVSPSSFPPPAAQKQVSVLSDFPDLFPFIRFPTGVFFVPRYPDWQERFVFSTVFSDFPL